MHYSPRRACYRLLPTDQPALEAIVAGLCPWRATKGERALAALKLRNLGY